MPARHSGQQCAGCCRLCTRCSGAFGVADSTHEYYGVSKCFGEAAASYFAHAEGLSCIVIRIGSYDVHAQDANWLRKAPNALHLSGYVSERDLNRLLVRCIEIPDISFALVHGISNNRFKRLDITMTRDRFGYAPQDDSFTIFQAELQK